MCVCVYVVFGYLASVVNYGKVGLPSRLLGAEKLGMAALLR